MKISEDGYTESFGRFPGKMQTKGKPVITVTQRVPGHMAMDQKISDLFVLY